MFQYFFLAPLLFLGLLLYFRIAGKYNIVDAPNERSSHDYVTIRGGGIVFWLAGLGWSLQNMPESLYFLAAFTLICCISFCDDVSSLHHNIRIVAHFAAVFIILFGAGTFLHLHWALWIPVCIFLVGVLNACNFMDGINGMTGLHSFVTLLSLQYVNCRVVEFTDSDFINYALCACAVFLIYNCRTRARCFAGDVGSMGMAFWIIFLLLQLMQKSDSLVWIFFLTVYGIDSTCTILHRICLRHNIFKPHRLHFFQILTNELKLPHLRVSGAYTLLQALVNAVIICVFMYCNELTGLLIGAGIAFVLSLVYLTKFKLMKKDRLSKIHNS